MANFGFLAEGPKCREPHGNSSLPHYSLSFWKIRKGQTPNLRLNGHPTLLNVPQQLTLGLGALTCGELGTGVGQEARNTLFCPFQEKFHTVVLRGVRNIYVGP